MSVPPPRPPLLLRGEGWRAAPTPAIPIGQMCPRGSPLLSPPAAQYRGSLHQVPLDMPTPPPSPLTWPWCSLLLSCCWDPRQVAVAALTRPAGGHRLGPQWAPGLPHGHVCLRACLGAQCLFQIQRPPEFCSSLIIKGLFAKIVISGLPGSIRYEILCGQRSSDRATTRFNAPRNPGVTSPHPKEKTNE